MIWMLMLVLTWDRQRALGPNRILVAQQAQAMEVRAQHREIERVQPASRLTPEEEKLHARFRAFWLGECRSTEHEPQCRGEDSGAPLAVERETQACTDCGGRGADGPGGDCPGAGR